MHLSPKWSMWRTCLSIADIFALVTLTGLYLSPSPLHARTDRRHDRVFALTRADVSPVYNGPDRTVVVVATIVDLSVAQMTRLRKRCSALRDRLPAAAPVSNMRLAWICALRR